MPLAPAAGKETKVATEIIRFAPPAPVVIVMLPGRVIVYARLASPVTLKLAFEAVSDVPAATVFAASPGTLVVPKFNAEVVVILIALAEAFPGRMSAIINKLDLTLDNCATHPSVKKGGLIAQASTDSRLLYLIAK